jgi:hypothetical protein
VFELLVNIERNHNESTLAAPFSRRVAIIGDSYA